MNNIIFNASAIPSLKKIKDNWKLIQEEYKSLPPDLFITNENRVAGDWFKSESIENFLKMHQVKKGWVKGWNAENNEGNEKWHNWGLIYDGKPLKNSQDCPITTKLLLEIPFIKIAGFSKMKANSRIGEHTDSTGLKHGSLAYHLGIDVPTDKPSQLFIDNFCITEENGQHFLFDATYKHSAICESDQDRGILYVDFDLKGLNIEISS